MYLLLSLALLAFPVQSARAADSTQTALLRYQLQEKLQKELDQRHKDMQAELEKFEAELRAESAENLQNAKDDLHSVINTYAIVGGVIIALLSFVLSFLGYDRIKSFIATATGKFDRQIESAIYRIDPRDLPIKLPATGMEKQLARLQRLDFRSLGTYQWLDDTCTRHAVVYLATQDAEAEKLKQFIVSKGLAEREDVAFVVYTKGGRIDPKILGEYDNVTFANSHLTLVQALFVAARGLVR